MRRKPIVAMGVAFAVALVVASGSASPARAATAPAGCYHPVTSPDGGAKVCFVPDGDHLFVCDTKADGHHPVARFTRSDSSGLKEEHSTLASPECTDVSLNIPEEGWVNYQACNYEGTTQLSCGNFSGKVSGHNDPARYQTYYSMFLRGEQRIPYLDTTPYVPQGLTHWPATDAMVVSYYDDNGGRARIAIVDRGSSAHLKSLYLDDRGHAAALATSANYLWVASTQADGTKKVIRYRWSTVAGAANNSEITRTSDYTLRASSFLEIYGSKMYVGSFHTDSNGTAYRYSLDANEVPQYDDHSFTVPSQVQGMAITAEHFVWSRSYGRNNDSTLVVDPRSGPIVRTVTAPNMSEDLATVGGELYVVYESAAMKYADADYQVRTIHHGKTSALIP